jgi:uncharacterized membrane protein
VSQGFLFIPTLLALLGVAAAVIAVWADRIGFLHELLDATTILQISASGARTVLSTIAGAMMTVISLVYSLTLIVLTLAAGNIAPRLLETFSTNRVNQITIGLLAATFLYSLICLYITGENEVPRLSVALAIMFSTVCLFWLVYFVHDVANRVLIDNEIGRNRKALRTAIDRLLAEEPRQSRDEEAALPDTDYDTVPSKRTGYVTSVDTHYLVDFAATHDTFIRLDIRPGDFVIEGSPIARIYGHDDIDDLSEALARSVLFHDARAPDGDVQFSIHLMVEIALRALSPGVNDSYTAISSIDHLSAALGRIVQRGVPSSLHCDDDNQPRLWVNLISVREIIGAALHPLRQAVAGNVLVTLRLIAAIDRIASLSSPEYSEALADHLKLIADDADRLVVNDADRAEIAEKVMQVRKTLKKLKSDDGS